MPTAGNVVNTTKELFVDKEDEVASPIKTFKEEQTVTRLNSFFARSTVEKVKLVITT